jgi:uncharacterized membrane protein
MRRALGARASFCHWTVNAVYWASMLVLLDFLTSSRWLDHGAFFNIYIYIYIYIIMGVVSEDVAWSKEDATTG